MFKNVAAKFIVFAFDATTNLPKTGDAANITAYVGKDYGTATVLADTSATEIDATNAKGYYLFDAAQGETNGDILHVTAKSSTSNIVVIGAPAAIFTRPTTGWLAPTVAARTLDVSTGGEAGLDWANVGSPTTTVDLSGTTIKTTQKVDVDTIKTNPVVNAGTITFPTTATLASTTNITAGTIATVTNLTNAPTAGDLTATMKTSVQTAADAAITANAKTASLTYTIANQLDVNVIDWKGATAPAMTGDAFARLGAPAGASVSADVAAVKVDTTAIKVYPDRVVPRGTVSGTAPTTTSFTPSTLTPTGVDADQFKGRIIVFDNTTTTTALRGQATDITANTAAGLPVFTYTALTSAPQSGDTFSIV